jgi:two-component system OmpR family sensor kinase
MNEGGPERDYQIVENDRGVQQLVVFQPIIHRGQLLGIVQVSTSTGPLKDILIRQLITFISLATLALVIGLIAFLPILRRTLVPLSKMVNTVEQINAGNLNERLPVNQGQMEIDRLAVSFNGMLERLESAFAAEKEAKEQMRRFIADASHELRTPLTSIHGFLEVLLRGDVASKPEQLQKALVSMYSESERLTKLVQDLLLLARLDRKPTFQMKEGLLDEVLREMEPQLRLLAGNRSVHFSVQSHVRTAFDRDRIKQVILNLFQNAVQHTDPDHGMIRVSLDRVPEGVMLSVQDNGPGLPEEHLPHLFERFYRIDTSRTRKSGGAGLGLAITKSIVELHGGKVQVESKPGEGARFSVFLPAVEHHRDVHT